MLNPLPHNKNDDFARLKTVTAKKKISVPEKLKFGVRRVENIVAIRENAGYQHFLLFPQCFQNDTFWGSLKVGIVW